uniref:ZPT4-4 n=1 Tax=Petunia hybrida TaxID=4102 RepID=O22091_PETHY|nr:ZPT4-4 [Petunia x hybrida]
MKQDQELRHLCKFCNKSFPCGRSLGGHMRTHLINISAFDDHKNEKYTKKKLPSIEATSSKFADYGLKENHKKTAKFVESSEEDTLLQNQNKVCKECGKRFQSWKALFGHMKCHSDKIVSSMNSTVDEESWNNDANYAIDHKQVILDSQSDNETAAPNRKKRSTRKLKRYMTSTTTSSNVTVVNVSPCVSEIEQEQEEVAMSLIILSRDVGNWIGLNPFTEFSGSSQPHQTEDGVLVKLKKVQNEKPEQGETSKSNVKACGVPRNGHKMENSFVPAKENKVEESSKKRNFELTEGDFSVTSNTKKLKDHASDSELNQDSEKKIKFQCTTCNKSFHSYQALGGHSTSHRKTKDLQNQATDSKIIKNSSKNNSTIDEFGEKDESFSVSKKLKGYECPLCFKIFQSGQALGGHKRSHLIAEAKSNNQVVMIEKPIPEIRDFLDLNLPAPVEEESTSEHVGFQPWWIGSSHKHEQLVGLISN